MMSAWALLRVGARPRSTIAISRRVVTRVGAVAAGHVGIAHRDGQRISGVVRARNMVEREDNADHLLDLALFRFAIPDDRMFDFAGTVFSDRNALFRGSEKDDTASLSDSDRGGDVAGEEELFDRHYFRIVIVQQQPDVAVNLQQPIRHRFGGIRFRDTIVDQAGETAGRVDNPIAHSGSAGVDAEDDHEDFFGVARN